jgi:pimeloyl-ACP methyl ester carboxylesterase
VPDPAFRYQKPRWLGRRLGGWYGGLITHRKHWDAFNASPVERLPLRPSSFARWVHQHYPSSRPLVDLGTGTGRDASFFARTGREVVALDYSTQSVARSAHRARQAGLRATWEPVNFYDARSTLAQGARLSRNEEPPDLYARFTLHALSDPGRQNIWRLASMSLRRGGRFFAEFRTTEDRGLPKAFGDHFRNFLDPDQVVAEIEAAGGRVVHRTSGFGLAPFGPEDPHVCRLVAEWGLPAMEQPGDLTTDLVVRRSGRDPAEAPTLLLLHGLTDSGSAWPDAVTRWGQRYSVLAVDARGHGESPRFTADQLRTGPAAVMVADVLQILEQLPHPPVVVGHSLGGAVALAAAVRDPDLVRCLVLEDPALRPTGHPRRSRRRGEERVKSVEASRAAADHGQLLELRRDRHPTWSDNELLQSGIAEQQVDLRYLARGDLLPTRTSQSLFAEVSVPTLVVSGDVSQDVRVTASRESRIAALGNPQVHVVRVTGAGHCVRRDQPDRFYDVVEAFLDAELSAPSTPVTAQSSARSPGGHSRNA